MAEAQRRKAAMQNGLNTTNNLSAKIDFSTPANLSNLAGKNVFLTGGASGLGALLVKTIAEAGAYVTFGDVNESAGKAYEKEHTAKGLK
jgi:NADPH:quinone reductase-like Zn-dependent oxidoreductase